MLPLSTGLPPMEPSTRSGTVGAARMPWPALPRAAPLGETPMRLLRMATVPTLIWMPMPSLPLITLPSMSARPPGTATLTPRPLGRAASPLTEVPMWLLRRVGLAPRRSTPTFWLLEMTLSSMTTLAPSTEMPAWLATLPASEARVPRRMLRTVTSSASTRMAEPVNPLMARPRTDDPSDPAAKTRPSTSGLAPE